MLLKVICHVRQVMCMMWAGQLSCSCYDYACNPKVICISNATFASVGVIQGETKQFLLHSLFLSKHLSMLLGHDDLGCTAAGLWYSVLQCCSAVKLAAVCSTAESAHAVLGKSDFSSQGVVSYPACAIRAEWAPRSPVIHIPWANSVQWIHQK